MYSDLIWFVSAIVLLFASLIALYFFMKHKYSVNTVRILYCITIAAVVVFAHLVYAALILPALISPNGKTGPNQSASNAMLNSISKAIDMYKDKFGVYPGEDATGLFNDRHTFVELILPYIKEDCWVGNEIVTRNNKLQIMSRHELPFYYTVPASKYNAPDGAKHNNVGYYLWTWGFNEKYYVGVFYMYFPKGPLQATWEINNWTR
jgi:hypothetical protein